MVSTFLELVSAMRSRTNSRGFFLLLFFVFMLCINRPVTAVEWTYNPATGHYYTLTEGRYMGIATEYANVNQPDWFDAQVEAESLGGYLVTINNATENNWLISTYGSTENFWLGFTDWASEGSWYWINGEPVTFTSWDVIQPDNAEGGEDCAHTNHNTQAGRWNDMGNKYLPHHPNLPYRGIVERDDPLPPDVPALSGWGLIVMLVLVGLIAVYFIRRSHSFREV